MNDVPYVQASQLAGGERIEVLRFDRRHERVRLGPHRHRDLELMYFDRGGGTHRLGRRSYEATAGDVVLLTPGTVHDASGLRDAAGWSVEFAPSAVGLRRSAAPDPGSSRSLTRLWWANPLLAPFLRADQQSAAARITVPPEERHLWEAHLGIMVTEVTERRDGHREMLGAYLTVVLVALGRLVVGNRTAGHPDPALTGVFDVIEQRYTGSLSTADVADEVGLTPGHLTTLVRRHTGRTVGEWITERRMAAARDLLAGTSLSVAQVADRVGYPDATYFSRRFRQAHAVPPGRWRTEARAPVSGSAPGP